MTRIGVMKAFVLIACTTVLPGCRSTVTNPPKDATASMGSSVTLECGVTGDNHFMWAEFITSVIGEAIFLDPPGGQPESPHYEIEGTYDLIIPSLLTTDGGLYGCDSVTATSDYHTANLVVVEAPQLLIPNLVAGRETSVHCDCIFGGPIPSDLAEDHVPNLRVYIDGQLQSGYTPVLTPGRPGDAADYEVSTLNLDFNYTASIADNGLNVTCEVFTTNPQFSKSMSQLLNVRYPVQNIALSPVQSSYYISETITCTAEGNPDPEIRWQPKLSNGAMPVAGPVLTMLENMVGPNEWECQAQNNVEVVETITEIIEFEVLDETAPEPGRASPISISTSLLLVLVLVFFICS